MTCLQLVIKSLPLLSLCAFAPPLEAQGTPAGPGSIIVLVEPGAVFIPQGLTRALPATAQVNIGRLREIFARHQLVAIRRATPFWDEFRRATPSARVYARRKNELMPPDALTDMSLMFVLEFPDTVRVAELLQELNASDGIVYAEPDRPIRALTVPAHQTRHGELGHVVLSPNDPRFLEGNNWGFDGAWGVRALSAWNIQTAQPSTRIAFFDTGIESNTDFGGVSRIADQYDFVNSDANAYPDLDQRSPDHGLGVAGVAAAQTNDGFGVAGLCGGFAPSNPGCSILAAKVLGSLTIVQRATEWLGTTSMVADATSWALARQARVINNSWCNSTQNRNVHDAFRNAYLSNVVVTAAAGNTFHDPSSGWDCGQDTPSKQVAPASFGDILMSVGATDPQGYRVTRARGYNWESGYGAGLTVVAPGVDHYSDAFSNTTAWFGGTSEATPFVSGLAGLIFSEGTAKGYQFTAWDVRQIIENTARPPANTPPGYTSETGWGIIDAGKALQVLQPPNQLTFVNLPNVVGAQCYARTGTQSWTFWATWIVEFANRCEIRNTVAFAKRYVTPPIVWGRPVSDGGVTPSNPNSEVFFTGIVSGSVTTTSATLRTYVYQLYDLQGHYLGWWPSPPDQVNWGYAVLGEVAPFSVTAAAPGYVTTKSTYPLTGSASDPANGWQWDQSYNSAPWQFWASAQSSQFVAYAGQYTLDWGV